MVMLLRRTWVDWSVFVCMVVAAARCRGPIAAGLFTVFAVAVAVVAARESWKLVQLADIGPTRSAGGSEAHHRS
ncbi:hypothetical protein ADK34_21700 [Streptomyces viridochromogenes]|uniref:Uncharacterized protein n=1 Tax=Streptomyces viridochromogenes TaxID=1938 RepID=A0A0L8K9L0_STRVR|nr:hypothetical protein ADK34_21700 [Streptomyces viridochromogenes]